MDKKNVTYIYNGLLPMKEILPFGIWMNLENIMLSKISTMQDKYYTTALIQGI